MKLHFFRYFLTILIFLAISPGTSIYAEETPQEAPPANQKVVKVGVYLNFPFVYERNSLPTGFHVELLKEIAKLENWKIEYEFLGSLKNVLNALQDESLDLGMGLAKTEERQEYLLFSNEKTAAQKNQVFVSSKREDIQQIADLDGKTVGYINQDSIGQSFKDICSKLGIEPLPRQINSYEQLAGAIITGVVDAGIFSAFQGKKSAQLYDLRPTPITFKKTEVYFAAPKNSNGELISKIDSHLKAWKIEKDSPFYTLETEFFTNTLPHKTRWTKRETLITSCLCLLLIIFGVLLGNFMARETPRKTLSKATIRNLLLFIFGITITFWILDSFVEWFFFNDQNQLDLLQLAITKVPPENLYIRGMFFGISCFFGLFIAKYMSNYEEALNLLMVSVDRFERLTDNAPDMIYRMALPSGRYEFVSKASTEICGYTPEEFYKRPRLMEHIIHPDWEEYFETQWKNLIAGEMPPYYEYQIITKSGETRWINQRNTLYMNSAGQATAIEAIVTDISNFKPQPSSPPEEPGTE